VKIESMGKININNMIIKIYVFFLFEIESLFKVSYL
jgi:hypothetical protein